MSLETDLSEGVVVEVNANRLVEALINVLDNASYVTAKGGTVTLRLRAGLPAGVGFKGARFEGVRFEVEDHGTGIPEGVRSRIFDPFFTTKPIGEGSGLGLAITRRVVEEHGGLIQVDTRQGAGTTVCIDLPVRESGS